MSRVALIAAISENGVIGDSGAMPWHIPADLKHFREITWGKPIIMGSRTFESIGKPLPGRTNIILTRQRLSIPNVQVVHSFREALVLASDSSEMIVIGGATVYEQALPIADRLYITRIHATFEGDRYFPKIDWNRWREVEHRDYPADEKNSFDLSFCVFEPSEPA